MSEPIFHIATRADWLRARRAGTYDTSTRGRTLAEEGFIHASRRDQVAGVFERYYADAGEPLLLLSISPDRLDSPIVVEAVGDDTFPHIYGPINVSAVSHATPLSPEGGSESFFRIFMREVYWRMVLVVVVIVAGVCGAVIGSQFGGDWSALAGFGIAAVVAVPFVVLLERRRG